MSGSVTYYLAPPHAQVIISLLVSGRILVNKSKSTWKDLKAPDKSCQGRSLKHENVILKINCPEGHSEKVYTERKVSKSAHKGKKETLTENMKTVKALFQIPRMQNDV